MSDMMYMEQLDAVAADAVGLIREKTETYGDSWKKRDGPGAWFTVVRPIDRLEGIVKKHGGDIFAAIRTDPAGWDGSALACVRDIMNYMILIEAQARARLGAGSHGPARKAPERPTLAGDGGSKPECDQCGGTYDPINCVRHIAYSDKFFCSPTCAKRFAGESEPSPASGSHHGLEPEVLCRGMDARTLGREARLDAMERAGEVTEDTLGAGGSAGRPASGTTYTRSKDARAREWFARSRALAADLGLEIEERDTMNYISMQVDIR